MNKTPREIATEIAMKWGPQHDVVNLGAAIDAALTKAIADERERCAGIAQRYSEAELIPRLVRESVIGYRLAAKEIENEIRRDSTGEDHSNVTEG
jgi:hypothetical protein